MKRQGFSLLELVLLIAIVAMLSAVLYPLFQQAAAKSRKTTCLDNVRQLAQACLMYCDDNNDYLPIGYLQSSNASFNATAYDGSPMYSCMAQGVLPYVGGDVHVFHCPNVKKPANAYCYPTADPATDGMPGATMGWSSRDETSGAYDAIDNPAHTLLLLCAPFNEKRNLQATRRALVDWSIFPVDKTAHPHVVLQPGEFWPGNVFDQYNSGKDLSWGSLVIQDPSDWLRPKSQQPWLLQIHNGGTNYGYCDGHAAWHRFKQTRYPNNEWTRDGSD
jgi:prepilin-type processing-associated H-X9-DG protein